jgi:hypothetical protein
MILNANLLCNCRKAFNFNKHLKYGKDTFRFFLNTRW